MDIVAVDDKNKIARLKEPVWFDTGRKMADGTPRTIAAYTVLELAEYKSKGSRTDTYDEDGDEILIPWKRLGKASDMVEVVAQPNNGMTTTRAGRKKASA